MENTLFDSWPDTYDAWFQTQVGQYVKKYESEILLELLAPQKGELIFDAGCGTGVFTEGVVKCGARVMGMDLSAPMVAQGVRRLNGMDFSGICGDMSTLPFGDNTFDRAFSMTAIEFIDDAHLAIRELDRVVKKGGCVVVTTLNSLSPWAEHRIQKGQQGHSLFQHATFRSPADMRKLVPHAKAVKTAIHFQKDTPVEHIEEIEAEGTARQLETGAFLAVGWVKE